MRTTAYIRVAKDPDARTAAGRRPKITANSRYTDEPIRHVSRGHALPTIAFAVALEIPDGLFERAAEVIAELTIPEDAAKIAATVTRLKS